MNKYILVFGRHPELSLLELRGWAEANKVNIDVQFVGQESALVSGLTERHSVDLINDLGGLVKVALLIKEIADTKFEWAEELSGIIQKQVEAEKITFGLSWLMPPAHFKKNETNRIGLSVKRLLKEAGRKVRFVEAKELALSSVQVTKNKLIESGAEIIIIKTDEGWLIAKTVGVQPFEDWSRRDYGRPKRDAKSGMLPPKLARIMLNMLGVSPEGILLDPFCGSGTVATEAGALGWKKIVCSDVSSRAVNDTKKNVSWFQDKYQIDLELRTGVVPIEELSSLVKSNSVLAIVTEGYLGPVLSKPPRQKDVEKYRTELVPIYKTLLKEIVRVLKDGGRAVVAMPRWVDRDGNHHTLLRLRSALPPGLKTYHLHKADENVPVYNREGQFVARELVVLERKPRSAKT